MITDTLLTDFGFYRPADSEEYRAKNFLDVWLEPYADGRYRANIGAQARFVSNEADLKKFVELMYIIATPKELD